MDGFEPPEAEILKATVDQLQTTSIQASWKRISAFTMLKMPVRSIE
jgi:hypothetical protein